MLVPRSVGSLMNCPYCSSLTFASVVKQFTIRSICLSSALLNLLFLHSLHDNFGVLNNDLGSPEDLDEDGLAFGARVSKVCIEASGQTGTFVSLQLWNAFVSLVNLELQTGTFEHPNICDSSINPNVSVFVADVKSATASPTLEKSFSGAKTRFSSENKTNFEFRQLSDPDSPKKSKTTSYSILKHEQQRR